MQLVGRLLKVSTCVCVCYFNHAYDLIWILSELSELTFCDLLSLFLRRLSPPRKEEVQEMPAALENAGVNVWVALK